MLLSRFKRLAVLSLSCLLVWTGWTSLGHAAPLEDSSPEPKVEWDKKFGDSSASFRGRSVIPTLEGGYVAVGEISRKDLPDPEGFVVKVDQDGGVEWEQRLQTTGDLYIEGVETYQIIQTSDRGYLVSGASTDRSGKPLTIPYLAKLDNQGNIEWSRPYNDLSGLYQYGQSVAETSDGGFVVTGYSVYSSGDAPAYLLKVDDKGNKLWYRSFYPNDNQYFEEVITTPDGGILAVGNIDSFISPDFDASVIVKLNSQGEVEWEKRQTAPRTGRRAHSVQLSEDGGYIVSGAFRQNGKWTTFVMKTDDRGETIWEKQYPSGGDGSEDTYNQLKTTEHGYALIGYSSRGEYPESILQYQILRLDHDGEIIGKLHYAAPGLASVGKGAPTADGGFILSGQVKEGGSSRMQLVKLSGAGLEEPPGDPELAELRFSDKSLKLGVGERKPSVLEAVYTDGSVTDVTYLADFTSLNPEIANVDHEGAITGISPGIAEITGEYGGRRAVLSVSVHDDPGEPHPAPRGFHLDSNDYSVTVGDELDIQAFFIGEDGKAVNVTGETRFTTADPGVAEIDEYGNTIGIRPGLTTITAYYAGYSYTSSLLVVRPYTPGSQGESVEPGLTEA